MRTRSRRIKRMKRTRRKQRGGSTPLVYAPGEPAAIKVFTSADKMKPTLQALLASLKKHHYAYEVLGMGKPWGGFRTKMENYLEGIRGVQDQDSILIFVDAYDMLCIKDADRMLKAYKARDSNAPIVVSTEIYCFYRENCDIRCLEWFDHHKKKGGSEEIKKGFVRPDWRDFYEAPEPVFLNSGFIMGPARVLARMFEEMITYKDTDDQIALIHYMLEHKDEFDLDYNEKFIRVKAKIRERYGDEDGKKGPGFVHFPGTRTADEQEISLKKYMRPYFMEPVPGIPEKN